MKENYSAFEDDELVRMLKGKKKESDFAFKAIYQRYAPRLNAYCVRVLNNQEEAEDVFQETFIRFFENVRNDKDRGTVQGFLITIARNLCLNRKRDKKKTVGIEDFHLTIDMEQQNDQKEIFGMIKMAIELLDFEYREPLVLRMYDGLSYDEIAEVCEISPENARKRVFRAKQKIKKIIEPNYNEMYS